MPGDGTNGVTIEAAATGDPERSWMVMDHPFRSFELFSLLVVDDPKQFVEVLGSDSEDLFQQWRIQRSDYLLNHTIARMLL